MNYVWSQGSENIHYTKVKYQETSYDRHTATAFYTSCSEHKKILQRRILWKEIKQQINKYDSIGFIKSYSRTVL